MAENIMTIKMPYITDQDEKTRLCANIDIDGVEKTLYFEVDKQYGKYLCTERADAFLTALLITAMEHNYNINSEAPVSAKLYYQLTSYFIPIISNSYNGLNAIDIKADVNEDILPSENGVGTGFTAGVDSLYSVIKHTNIDIPQYKLTHLLLTSTGLRIKDETKLKKWFEHEINARSEAARDLGLPLVAVFSNVDKFYNFPRKTFSDFGTFHFASCVLSLQKLFGKYYHSSTFYISDFDINTQGDASRNDVFNLKCLSNENVSFYSAGTEKTRIQKVEYIADNPIAQKELNVCGATISGENHSINDKMNCGVCSKCLRTICELYALDKLDKYEEIFNTKVFRSNIQKYIAKMNSMDSSYFSNEVISRLKQRSKIKPGYYFWTAVYGPIFYLRSLCRKSNFLKKLYYYFKIDIFVQGFRNEEVYESFKNKQKTGNK